jgi:peptide/nickel transport system substrate-binding protein
MYVKKLLVLGLAAILVAGCTKVDQSISGSGSTGAQVGNGQRHSFTMPHVLRYATAEDVSTLNPHLATQLTLSFMSSMTMAWLIKTGPDSNPVPELVTEVPTKANGGISKDGLTITYHLRKDAKWSDGVPFTADDVVFSIKTVLNPATNEVGRDGWDLITKVDEPDKYTVTLHMKKQYSPFVVTFFATAGANPCVLPKHLLDKYPNINKVAYNSLPVGIGPFKYSSWKRSDSIEMVPDPLYFRGQPKLQKIIFKIVPDRNTVLTQLTTHEIDLWVPITAAYYDRVKVLSDIAVLHQPGFNFDHLDFNTSHPIVADVRVRRALRFGIDRQAIKEKIRHGIGTISDNILGYNHPAYHPIPLSGFDPEAAKKLLDAAGWVPGPDGVRVKNGQRFSLTMATGAGLPDTDQIIELIRANWTLLGVELNVQHFQSALMFAVPNGTIYAGKWDVTMFAWNLDNFADLSPEYGCQSFPPKGQNVGRWCDKRADDAMKAFKLEYDPAKRNPYDYIATDEIASQVPLIVMQIRDSIEAYNSDLKNWHPNPVDPFDDMMNVDI